jgi:hypothetical protein
MREDQGRIYTLDDVYTSKLRVSAFSRQNTRISSI